MDKKIDAERDEIEPMRRTLWAIEQDVLKVTSSMPPGCWGRIIELRYIQGMGWKKVASEMGRSVDWAFKLHGHALVVFAQTHNRLGIDNIVLT